MIHARVEVNLPGHHRIARIPKAKRLAAIGAWLVALTYTRREELDGFAPHGAFDAFDARTALDALVQVGLLRITSGGYMVHNYEAMNETKADITERKSVTLRRVQKHRGNAYVTPEVAEAVTRYTSVTNEIVTRTESESESESESELKIPPLGAFVSGPFPREEQAAGQVASAVDHLGASFLAADWARGVQSVTGSPCVVPTGGELRKFAEVVAACAAEVPGPEWATAQGGAFARACADGPLNVFRFADWIRGGRKSAAKARGGGAKQPLSPPREGAGKGLPVPSARSVADVVDDMIREAK